MSKALQKNILIFGGMMILVTLVVIFVQQSVSRAQNVEATATACPQVGETTQAGSSGNVSDLPTVEPRPPGEAPQEVNPRHIPGQSETQTTEKDDPPACP